MSNFWTLLDKLTDLYTAAIAVSAFKNTVQKYAASESSSPDALALLLDAKLRETEQLCEDLMKDPIVRTVIDHRNPDFFKAFLKELAR